MDLGKQTESCLMVDGDVQTSRTETTEATTQASFVPTTPTTPIVCYVPVESQVESTTTTFTSELLKDNDEMTKFYTGLPSWKVFHHLVCFLSTCCPALSSSITKVSLSDRLLLTLMRLRLNSQLEDLSYRFGIPVSTAADVSCKMIATMHAQLKFLIEWPTQKTCRTDMPQIFLPKLHYRSVYKFDHEHAHYETLYSSNFVVPMHVTNNSFQMTKIT